MGTSNIKAIVLNHEWKFSEDKELMAEELSKMRGLKLLILSGNEPSSFSGRPFLSRSEIIPKSQKDFLSNSLRCLMWHKYPFTSLPLKFQPSELVELNMSNSMINRLWKGIKNLPCLKRVDLSNSIYLVETPNFEGMPNLERLDLSGCKKLRKVHPSIGLLKQLAFLSLRSCKSLVSLNLGSVSYLSSLRVLYLSGCNKLKNTPDFTGLTNLEYLHLDSCKSLSTIHKSIGALMKLKFLSLSHCINLVMIPNSINTMKSLTTIDLYECLKLKNFPLGQRSELGESVYFAISGYVPSSYLGSLIVLDLGFCNLFDVPYTIGELGCLEKLNLQGNNFGSLPDTISELHSLAYLNLSHCHMLHSLPLLPSTNASSVGTYFGIESGAHNHRSGLYLFNCSKLVESKHSQLLGWELALAWLTRLVEEPRHFRCGFDIVVPGSVIPEWFNHQFGGGSVIRIVHSDADDNWIGFAFCVCFDSDHQDLAFVSMMLSFESEHTEETFHMPLHQMQTKNLKIKFYSKHLWLIYISRPHCHFVKTGAHISFKAHPHLHVRSWGLRMLFKQDIVAMQMNSNYEKEPQSKLQITSESSQVDRLRYDIIHEIVNPRWMSSGSEKIQLPYNWLATEEEEIEIMGAKEKENNLSFIGLGQPLSEHTPSSSR